MYIDIRNATFCISNVYYKQNLFWVFQKKQLSEGCKTDALNSFVKPTCRRMAPVNMREFDWAEFAELKVDHFNLLLSVRQPVIKRRDFFPVREDVIHSSGLNPAFYCLSGVSLNLNLSICRIFFFFVRIELSRLRGVHWLIYSFYLSSGKIITLLLRDLFVSLKLSYNETSVKLMRLSNVLMLKYKEQF